MRARLRVYNDYMLEWLWQIKLNRYDDKDTRRLIQAGEYKPSMVPSHILDLGAHKGFATEWFATRYPTAIIHAYEPNEKMFKKLARRAKKYPNVQIFNQAIADHDGVATFHISPRNVSSSLFDKGEAVDVPCVTLRTAVERLGGTGVFVKIDIEGAEFDALKDIPSEVTEIVGEVHPEKAAKNIEELRECLHDFHNVTIGEGKSLFRARR